MTSAISDEKSKRSLAEALSSASARYVRETQKSYEIIRAENKKVCDACAHCGGVIEAVSAEMKRSTGEMQRFEGELAAALNLLPPAGAQSPSSRPPSLLSSAKAKGLGNLLAAANQAVADVCDLATNLERRIDACLEKRSRSFPSSTSSSAPTMLDGGKESKFTSAGLDEITIQTSKGEAKNLEAFLAEDDE